ncbi:erythromycin resistance leader peptide [Aneurinibacillus sp. REN35]
MTHSITLRFPTLNQ